ncbi:hypothetical protein [Caulobacter endophyticus]|uniref:hypothetical protein n=1 Tax=Caulobacter endophyticus TaxID=2172652 RepID=UPI00240FC634|nr:hypothetical protein [Caulobacter endophyticus]MDG2529455.1 hypothetical protein [Caulobacter endophyticus]
MARRSMRLGWTALLILAAGPAHTAAWTQPKGGKEVIVSVHRQDSSHGFDLGGEAVDIVDYRKTELQGFAEYGLFDRLTLRAQGSVRRLRTRNARDTEPGHLELAARYRISSGDTWVLSTESAVRLPGGDGDPGAAQRGSPDAELDTRLLLGKSARLAGREVFLDLQAGWRSRDGDAPDERRLEVTLGGRPTGRLMLIGQVFDVASVGAGQGVYERYRYRNLQLTAVYDLPAGWSVQAGAMGTASGRNALRERGGVLAVWRRF